MPATSSSPTRRRFVGAATGAVAVARASQPDKIGAAARDQAWHAYLVRPTEAHQCRLLNVAYAEAGPADGPPVVLLHGWPYDIYSFVDVVPLLASAGYRVLSRICAATARRAFFQARRFTTASRRHSPSMSSR
jgi:hypothetical protein